MRLNRKGFMMAEVVVVSAVVVITLTTLYASYNKIYSLYKARLNYNDTNTLYKLAYYRDCLIKDEHIGIGANNKMESYISSLNSGDYADLAENEDEHWNYYGLKRNEEESYKIFLIFNDNKNINSNNTILNNSDISSTYHDYISYLANSVDLTKTKYVMIMERCSDSEKKDCKYAYLEVEMEQP